MTEQICVEPPNLKRWRKPANGGLKTFGGKVFDSSLFALNPGYSLKFRWYLHVVFWGLVICGTEEEVKEKRLCSPAAQTVCACAN